jgi:hypothetical protein
MKADICFNLHPTFGGCIGLLGASSWREALRPIEANKIETVYLCFDMDKHQKNGVLKAERQLGEELTRRGVNVWVSEWEEKFNGPDEAIKAGACVSYKIYEEVHHE